MQEAKVQEGYPCDAAEQAARVKKWNVSLTPCMVTAAGGKSAGTAVATRSHIGMSQPLIVKNTNHTHPVGRFCMKRVQAIMSPVTVKV